ncbi:50S ribosomal protein L31e [Candidatus Woesearchaeota archaeon]|nr:MAG: 50S ribosomal protein L31e [Candidatus Woesearchaeota archaeon]
MLERSYTVPLRRGFVKVPKYKRAQKAMATLREFMAKHMKSDDIKIGPELNKKVWDNGMRNPPHHVKVTAKKDDEGIVRVELAGFEYVEKKKEKKEKKDDSPMMEKIKKMTGVGKENKKEDIKEEKAKKEKEVEEELKGE